MINLIAANWKMTGNRASWRQLAQAAAHSMNHLSPNTEVVICPPHIAIPDVSNTLKGASHVHLGAQNVHEKPRGAHTGSTSIEMLKEFNVEYCILGHSERRLAGEKDEQIGAKLEKCVYSGIRPILCVGETWEDRENKQTINVLDQQLLAGLNSVQLQHGLELAVAYEPVWAISSSGSGRKASPKDVEEAFRFLRSSLVHAYGDMGYDIPLLYGGSVAPENVAGYAANNDINGVLVGSVSLDSERFLKTAKEFIAAKGK